MIQPQITDKIIHTSEYPKYISEQDIIDLLENKQIKNMSFRTKTLSYSLVLVENKSFNTLEEMEEYLHNAPEYYGRRYIYVSSIFSVLKNRIKNFDKIYEVYSIDEESEVPYVKTNYVEEVRYTLSFETRLIISCVARPWREFKYTVFNSGEHSYADFDVTVDFNIGHDDWLEYDIYKLKPYDSFFSSIYDTMEDCEYNIYKSVVTAKLNDIVKEKIDNYNKIIAETELRLSQAKERLNTLNNFLTDESRKILTSIINNSGGYTSNEPIKCTSSKTAGVAP